MADVENGTFTITNLGHFEVESFDPLLNPPEVGILGVGSITEQAGERKIGLSLTFDHRAVDGADAARFLGSIADALAHPMRLLPIEPHPTFRTGAVDGDADRTVRANADEEMSVDVETRGFRWRADEPEDRGGSNSAPTPVEQFLGSLASCLSITVEHFAARRDLQFDDVDVTVFAEPSDGKMERLDVEVNVTTTEDDDEVQRIVETAKRGCFVSLVIDDDIDQSFSVIITSPK